MARLTAETAYVHEGCTITESEFGAFTEIGAGSRIAHSTFGDYAYCDRYADIANATIGKFSNIAAFTRIGATDHPLDTAACHHFLYRSADYWDDARDDAGFFAHRKSRRAWIGNDTWIGHGAMIKPDVSVGHGAVIAAGAVVTKDVEAYTIVAGVPAKKMRRRLDEKTANRMIDLAWWDWPHDRLRSTLEDFRALSADAFIDKHAR